MNFVSAVDALDPLRSLLKSEHHWKINFRQNREETYTALWRSLPSSAAALVRYNVIGSITKTKTKD